MRVEPAFFRDEEGTSTAVSPAPGVADGMMESMRIGAAPPESSGAEGLGGLGGVSADCEGTREAPAAEIGGGHIVGGRAGGRDLEKPMLPNSSLFIE